MNKLVEFLRRFFHIHKWSRWEQFDYFQIRVCSTCGFAEKISEYNCERGIHKWKPWKSEELHFIDSYTHKKIEGSEHDGRRRFCEICNARELR